MQNQVDPSEVSVAVGGLALVGAFLEWCRRGFKSAKDEAAGWRAEAKRLEDAIADREVAMQQRVDQLAHDTDAKIAGMARDNQAAVNRLTDALGLVQANMARREDVSDIGRKVDQLLLQMANSSH